MSLALIHCLFCGVRPSLTGCPLSALKETNTNMSTRGKSEFWRLRLTLHSRFHQASFVPKSSGSCSVYGSGCSANVVALKSPLICAVSAVEKLSSLSQRQTLAHLMLIALATGLLQNTQILRHKTGRWTKMPVTFLVH